MPKAAPYLLAWSPASSAYELVGNISHGLEEIEPGSAAWFAWLKQVSSFAFHGKAGRYTVRKEVRSYGEAYWYGYQRSGQKLAKKYLGTTTDLTIARLEQIATQFSAPRPTSRELAAQKNAAEISFPASESPGHDPLLTTKLHVPRPRPRLVQRASLSERLQQGCERALTLIVAPAGFGKTTALSAWLGQSARAAAWVSLEQSDNDPARFWSYALAALDTLQPGICKPALSLLHAPQPAPITSVLTVASNCLNSLAEESMLIFDDYHEITSQPIHDTLAFLLDHLPSRLHLAILTRSEPALPLARLRVRDQLTEVRTGDLRFSHNETKAFFEIMVNVTLSEEEIAMLEARTEGWVAGLQLAALSLGQQQDVGSFLTTFTGSHRYIVAYLAEEVLQRLPERVQQFLLYSSLLERLSSSLCQAVTGQEDCRATLVYLERANLFIVTLDEEGVWYRYHQLFADFLRDRLKASEQLATIASLHYKAALWYEQHNQISEALHHLLAAGERERAARLIEKRGGRLIEQGLWMPLLRWINTFPEEMGFSHAHFCLLHAEALAFSGKLTRAEMQLQRAERLLLEASRQEVRFACLWGEFYSTRTLIAAYQMLAAHDIQPRQVLALARQAQRHLEASQPFWLGVLMLCEGFVEMTGENWVAASAAFREASRLHEGINQPLAMLSLSNQALTLHFRGQFHQALAVYERIIDFARHGLPVSALCLACYGRGHILYEWDRLEEAERELQEGIECGKFWDLGFTGVFVYLFMVLGQVKAARGEPAAAHEAFQQAERFARDYHIDKDLVTALALHARFYVAQGNLEMGLYWAQAFERQQEQAGHAWRRGEPVMLVQEHLILAWIYLKCGRIDDALALLAWLQHTVEAKEMDRFLIQLLIIRALACQEQKRTRLARATLLRALSLAEPQGYIRLFVNEGAPLAALLRQLRDQPGKAVPLAYVNTLLARMQSTIPAAGATALLSGRELEVLRLLADGMSNQEIARELVIALSTVKWHIKQIYNKLEVSNRVQMLTRARERHLI